MKTNKYFNEQGLQKNLIENLSPVITILDN